jgi:hypothetical protein
MVFFCPTKCHFGQVNLAPTILTRFFSLNHRDNNIIWVATKNIYIILTILVKTNMKILINDPT